MMKPTRKGFLAGVLLLVLATACTSCASKGGKAAQPSGAARDYTFFVCSDTQRNSLSLLISRDAIGTRPTAVSWSSH
jgi:hypothetical protein